MKKYISQTYKMFIYLVSVEATVGLTMAIETYQSFTTAGLRSKAGVRADVAIATVGLTIKIHQGCKKLYFLHLSHLLKYHMLVVLYSMIHLAHTLYHFAMASTLGQLRFVVRK